jgi:alpha-tubulin suppressor-like RCC1 family protein
LSSAGGVRCWGTNFSGQLGDGTNLNSSTPVEVSGLSSGVTAIAAGSAHTCALLARGAMRCWGTNFSGQLGDGTNVNRSAPVDVSGLPSARPWVRWQWL